MNSRKHSLQHLHNLQAMHPTKLFRQVLRYIALRCREMPVKIPEIFFRTNFKAVTPACFFHKLHKIVKLIFTAEFTLNAFPHCKANVVPPFWFKICKNFITRFIFYVKHIIFFALGVVISSFFTVINKAEVNKIFNRDKVGFVNQRIGFECVCVIFFCNQLYLLKYFLTVLLSWVSHTKPLGA